MKFKLMQSFGKIRRKIMMERYLIRSRSWLVHLIVILMWILLMGRCAKKTDEGLMGPSGPVIDSRTGVTWVVVQGGTFSMGSDSSVWSNETPVHDVTLSGYQISRYEVTIAQFAAFLNEYKSDSVKSGTYKGKPLVAGNSLGIIKSEGEWHASVGVSDNNPVLAVSWYGVNEFCQYYGYRLPTEAEWEYAARGGVKGKGYAYSGSNTPNNVAWSSENSMYLPHEVGTKQPNELGLYDMSGNVWEWCSDWYGAYTKDAQTNPPGPAGGSQRVIRGGCVMLDKYGVTCTVRGYVDPGTVNNIAGHIGFRPAR
jgi:formylglycine-generating enzyme required for sulfatase activity